MKAFCEKIRCYARAESTDIFRKRKL